ncbi:MAG: sulfotransferase [Marinobacter sp.]|uniref:sulfotransferase family protein n=1 Tax=Marinobacter sp. TaxID=50741 RepID=UPI003297866A
MKKIARVRNVLARVVLKCFGIPVRIVEKRFFPASRKIIAVAPTFIIGAPRTGSTILYQALTNAYQFAYIDNTACTWHRNLRFGLWLSQKKWGNTPHNNFKADHGNTSKFGGHAPSECGQFWYRWLPRDRHFIDHDEVTDRMVQEIREEVLGASGYLQRPLLFKNLNAGQRLRLIKKAFPDAKIIFVRRDPRFVTRSILKARKKVGTPTNQWWSIMPSNVNDLLQLPEPEMCAAQVYYLERQIEEDLTLFPEDNIRAVHYQELGEELVRLLAEWCGVPERPGEQMPEFMHDDPTSLPPQEREELDKLVSKYPFSKELFV